MKRQRLNKNQSIASGTVPASTTSDLIGNFFFAISNFAPRAYAYLTKNWIKVLVLIASATQTFALVDFIAPDWAWWLPYIAILLMEGAVPYWQHQEEQADLADGSKADTKKNSQEKIANVMVWITITMSAVTMVAGAIIEVADSEKLSSILKPSDGVTAFFGWVAIIGVFLLGTLHLITVWQYRRIDPLLLIQRERTAALNHQEREITRAMLSGQLHILRNQKQHIQKQLKKNAKRFGRRDANRRLKKEQNKTQ